MPTYAITGANGQLGSRAAELLLEQVDPADVVLLSRRPDELDARGATVRRADFDDPASLDDAFGGVDRLLLISTDVIGPARVALHKNAIDAAVRAGVKHVSYTSLPNPGPDNSAPVSQDHFQTEEALKASGLPWTFLRNALYSEFRIPEAQGAVAAGAFVHNLGDGQSAYVSREDCAAAAVGALVGDAEHDNVAYDITGPELLSGADLARIYGVEEKRVSDDELIEGLTAHVPAEVAEMLAGFGRAIREGALNQQSGAVEKLTGRAPASVQDVLAAV